MSTAPIRNRGQSTAIFLNQPTHNLAAPKHRTAHNKDEANERSFLFIEIAQRVRWLVSGIFRTEVIKYLGENGASERASGFHFKCVENDDLLFTSISSPEMKRQSIFDSIQTMRRSNVRTIIGSYAPQNLSQQQLIHLTFRAVRFCSPFH